MNTVKAISEYVVPVIIIMASIWFILFWYAFYLGKTLHTALNSSLRYLKSEMELNPKTCLSEVLAQLRQSFQVPDTKNIKVQNVSNFILDQTQQTAPRDDLRKCTRWWESLRALLEVFPILGILGTVCAMALSADSQSAGLDHSSRLAAVMSNFGDAMYSTIWGLGCAAVGMILMGIFAPKIEQWLSDTHEFKDFVIKAQEIHHSQRKSSQDEATA